MALASHYSARHVGRTSLFAPLLHSIAERLERRSVYLQTLEELSELSDRQLDDLGVARWEIKDVARKAAHGI